MNIRCQMAVAGCFILATTWASAQSRVPQIGYVFPAGAQQRTTIQAAVGGQFLNRPTGVYVSGKGVRATIVEYCRPYRDLNQFQKRLLLEQLWDLQETRLKRSHFQISDIRAFQKTLRKRGPWKMLDRDIDTDGYSVPGHPLLMDLESADLRQLRHIQSFFFFPSAKLQDNRQLAEHVVIEITVSRNATRSTRELRLVNAQGLSNPLRFQIDSLPEVRETEPNDAPQRVPKEFPPAIAKALTQEVHTLPFLVNGQVMPGDIDNLRFRATKGQKLRAQVYARALIPYLADAVPGWFQCVIAIHDEAGQELAYADDEGIDPDPTLRYTIPSNGVYTLVLRDALYRGRHDFVYRVAVTEASHPKLPRPPPPSDLGARETGTLQPPAEREPNNRNADAMRLRIPHVVHGTIAHPGDRDIFRLQGLKGRNVVAETYARRLGSPLDSLLRLSDADGDVIAWNDDFVLKEKHLHVDLTGLTTHHADAYLTATFPEDGTYYLELSDTQGHGSDAHSYHLRVSEPQPDFALRVTPSAICAPRGGNVPVMVHALRQDGLDGPITLRLFGDPPGTKLSSGTIPRGETRARLTLSMPAKATEEPVAIRLQGTAMHARTAVRRTALPADNVMQAFLWRHLVPAQEQLLYTTKGWNPIPSLIPVHNGPTELEPGRSVPVVLRAERPFKKKQGDTYTLKLDNPPAGVTLVPGATRLQPREWSFKLNYTPDAKGVAVLPPQNLIVAVIREYTPRRREGAPIPKRVKQRVGYLRAIPIESAP